jgi:hypothetical protein
LTRETVIGIADVANGDYQNTILMLPEYSPNLSGLALRLGHTMDVAYSKGILLFMWFGTLVSGEHPSKDGSGGHGEPSQEEETPEAVDAGGEESVKGVNRRPVERSCTAACDGVTYESSEKDYIQAQVVTKNGC